MAAIHNESAGGRRNIDCFCEMDKMTFVPLCRLQAVLNARLNGDSLPLTDIDGDEIHMPKLESPHMQDRLDVMWVAYGRGQPTLGLHLEDFTRRTQCSTCPHQIASGRPCGKTVPLQTADELSVARISLSHNGGGGGGGGRK